MANTSVPLTNVGSGYTIVTQVIPLTTGPNRAEQNSCQTLSPLRKFLKGEPKALGAVQIMIGVLTILLGIVMSVYPETIGVISGVVFWGSLFVKGALVMNIFSTIAAGITIIILSLDLVFSPIRFFCYNYDDYRCGLKNGINGVLLVFSLLQFTVSIAVSAFSCKATCTNEPTLNIINVVPNPEGSVPVVSSLPAHHAQPVVSALNAVAMSAPPLESPPAYTEKS